MNKFFTLLCSALLLTSCGTMKDPIDETSDDSTSTTSAELGIEDLTVGEGEEAKVGDTVEVHYVGTLEDGSKFDSSRDRGDTFSFTIGQGYVIEGWEKGVPGMKVGGLRKLTIPSDMGYGDFGTGPIPGGATLIFEVELVSIQ